MTKMFITEEVVKETKTTINPEYTKEIIVNLLQGNFDILDWEMESGWMSHKTTVELLLKDGTKLTIESP